MKGKLVVFEGIEGSGKSTQAKLFYDVIAKESDKCIFTVEPSQSAITKMIKAELLSSEERLDPRTLQLLFIADRSQHVELLIKPKLEEGYTVVTDRYYQSTVAYGSAFGAKHDISMDYLMAVNSIFPQPDVIFFLDVDPDTALKRVRQRKGPAERFDKLESLQKLHEAYYALSQRYSPKIWRKIDGSRKPEDAASDILNLWREIDGDPRRLKSH